MDGRTRCGWVGDDPAYRAYHDTEWGVPERDHRALFEKLILDGFQAGLSWIIILRKRDNFIRAFDGFQPAVIVNYRPDKVAELMADSGIVRNRRAPGRLAEPPYRAARCCLGRRCARRVSRRRSDAPHPTGGGRASQTDPRQLSRGRAAATDDEIPGRGPETRLGVFLSGARPSRRRRAR